MPSDEFVFGPVVSRRLGLSLGVDPIPFKTCSYDCIYCQLGRTTNRTVERAEFAPLERIVEAVRERLASGGVRPDYVTISGSGEPTLYSRLGELIRSIRSVTPVPIALLTNGSLLWDSGVREECREADVVLPSLDAGDEDLFRYINRPHEDLTLDRVVEGMAAFRREFAGDIRLEVFLLAGINAIEADVRRIGDRIARIGPDRIDLNTAVRPCVEDYAVRVPPDRLESLRRVLGPACDVIAPAPVPRGEAVAAARDPAILALLRRRPSTPAEIAAGLAMHPNEVAKRLAALERRKAVAWKVRDGSLFYAAAAPTEKSGNPPASP